MIKNRERLMTLGGRTVGTHVTPAVLVLCDDAYWCSLCHASFEGISLHRGDEHNLRVHEGKVYDALVTQSCDDQSDEINENISVDGSLALHRYLVGNLPRGWRCILTELYPYSK